jgi:hypothetical protein
MSYKMNSVIATCYYPISLHPTSKNAYRVYELSASNEHFSLQMYVSRKEQKQYIMEGTGIIRHKCDTFNNVCISRYGGKNHISKYDFGVGNFANPIYPGRDFANNHLPFGTRLEIKDKQLGLSQYYYRGDVFGRDEPINRVDIYHSSPYQLYKPISCELVVPKAVHSTRKEVIKFVQMKLNSIMRASLVVDGIEGPNTMFVLTDFNSHYNTCFESVCDSELIFELSVSEDSKGHLHFGKYTKDAK